MGIRDSSEVLEDEVLNYAQILTDGRRADLLVVADNKHRLAQVQGDQRHHVALAGFIDDDNVETGGVRVKVFDHARKRHDPDGNGATTLAHFSGRFGAQERNANSMPFADATDGVKPADERLALPRGGAVRLRGPSALVDQFDCRATQLLAQLFALCLQGFERDASAAI